MHIKLPDYLQETLKFPLPTIRRHLAERCSKTDQNFATTILNTQYVEDTLQLIQHTHQKFDYKKHLVHVGMGGSNLGAQMLVHSLGREHERTFDFLNSSDPESVMTVIEKYDPKDTLFCIASKSGKTMETLATLSLILKKFQNHNLPQKKWAESLLFCTNSAKRGDLIEISKKINIPVLDIPSTVCGRYGLFTPLGLLPSQFARISLPSLITGAQDCLSQLHNSPLPYLVQALLSHYRNRGVDQTVIMPYCNRLKIFTHWFAQLWAESLGKDGRGLTPILASGTSSQHSLMQLFLDGPKNKFFIFIKVKNFRQNSPPLDLNIPSMQKLQGHDLTKFTHDQLDKVLAAMETCNLPYALITLESLEEGELGALIAFTTLLTITLGECLEVNPFTQPSIELLKGS